MAAGYPQLLILCYYVTPMRVSLPYDKPIVAAVKVRGGIGSGVLSAVLCVYPVFLILLAASFMASPARTGLRAVGQIFAPYLFLPLLVLVPFAFRRGGLGVVLLRTLLVVCGVIFGARYMPAFAASTPAVDPSAAKLSVMTWNVFAENRREADLHEFLLQKPADVVVMQEVSWLWLRNDEIEAAYPYQLINPEETASGMTLLSAYPILDSGVLDGDRDLWDIPRLMWAKLDVNGTPVTVVTAHPISTYYSGRGCSLPVCFDPVLRDKQILAMHEQAIAPLLASGEPFVLAGDFNVTEREPAYADLSAGLTDAFKAVGTGLGTTWRPPSLMSQPFGILRIDYLFSGKHIFPTGISTDCTPRSSDHCVLIGQFQVNK